MPDEPRSPIVDRREVRQILRTLGESYCYAILAELIERVPDRDLHAVLRRYWPEQRFVTEAPPPASSVLDEVRDFDRATRDGAYFEEFLVTSKTYGGQSAGTMAFAAELNRLAENCLATGHPGDEEVHAALTILVELLCAIEEEPDRLVFVSDDSGLLTFGLDVGRLLDAWIVGLAARAEPDEFAARIVDAVQLLARGSAGPRMNTARRVADDAQRAALRQRLARER